MQYAPIHIKCPSCRHIASFHEPFDFYSSKEKVMGEKRPMHDWGGWIVVENYPSLFKWKTPTGSQQYLRGGGDNGNGGYPLLTYGIVQCSNCHCNEKHKLNWPSDAYWQCEIRGEILWAWDKEHATQILEFVEEKRRPSRFSYSLRYIPTHFLKAKVRQTVVKKLTAILNV